MLQPRPRVAQADAGRRLHRCRRRSQQAAVEYLDAQLAVAAVRAYFDPPRSRPGSDAMPDSVLRERLQQQDGYGRPPRLGGQVDVERHPVGESHVLDLEITPQYGQLV